MKVIRFLETSFNLEFYGKCLSNSVSNVFLQLVVILMFYVNDACVTSMEFDPSVFLFDP